MIGPSSEVRTIPARARQRCALGWVSYHGYSEPGVGNEVAAPGPDDLARSYGRRTGAAGLTSWICDFIARGTVMEAVNDG